MITIKFMQYMKFKAGQGFIVKEDTLLEALKQAQFEAWDVNAYQFEGMVIRCFEAIEDGVSEESALNELFNEVDSFNNVFGEIEEIELAIYDEY